MRNYLDLLKDVLDNGMVRSDRTGTGTISVFGRTLRFDLQKGFPLVTTKKVNTVAIVHELIWMISGAEDIRYLWANNVHIWDEWANKETGHVGPMYGTQWRNTRDFVWNGGEFVFNLDNGNDGYIDQLQGVISGIKEAPMSRRHLVSAWNVSELNDMALPPCHYAYQFYVREGDFGIMYLDCMVQMRSVDCFLGLPFDIASYGILLTMVAQLTGLRPGELVFNLGDTHIYNNHIEQVKLQLTRTPKELCNLVLNSAIIDIDDFEFGDVRFYDYYHHPAIKGAISI